MTAPTTTHTPEPGCKDRETETVVPTALGDLGAVIRMPTDPTAGSHPGIVLVDGSGDGDRYDWGGWPEWISDAGSVVLRHDKPGCGGSPGHWTQQTIADRARESLAAVRVLRDHPATAGQPVGLYGISQGGWVALLSAALEPDAIDFVVCHSGPGTTPAQQERDRIEAWLREAGHDDTSITEGLSWVDARADHLRSGEPVETVLAKQAEHADQPWYETVTAHVYDNPIALRFIRGILDFDPTQVMPQVRCPVLAVWGGNDTVVPAQTSLRAFAEHLPTNPAGHGFAVFPGADHGLFIADADPDVVRRDQLAPAYLPTLTAYVTDRRTDAPVRPLPPAAVVGC
jgi:uncharacterized protein